MDPGSERVIRDGDVQNVLQKLSNYEDYKVRRIYKYFRKDLTLIVESMGPHNLLSRLQETIDTKSYLELKENVGSSSYAEKLVGDILCAGRSAVMTFWESLFSVETGRSNPNIITILEEIVHAGDTLTEQILLDKEGPCLTTEVKDTQKLHKTHLWKKNRHLVENQPPGSILEKQTFDIAERFVNIMVVSKNKKKLQTENELIKAGIKHEKYMYEKRTDVERVLPNKLFRWCHQIGSVPHTVMVRGVPGVGKTTLMQKFVYDWVNGKLYQRFAFIFFFKFRILNQLEKVSLEMMILQEYPYLRKLLGTILQNPEQLLFIFDGLDEAVHEMDFWPSKLLNNTKQVDSVGVVVVSLVKQSLLPGCYVLMTSRPTQLASIGTGVFQRVFEIMGFFSSERKEYFDNFFKNKDISDEVFNYVKQNDTLYTFCYLPSYCWIICTVLSRSFQTTSSDQQVSLLPRTVTQLFAIFVANILSNHSLEKSGAQKLLQSIGWMAEHGVRNHRIIFDDRDLGSFNVDASSQLLSSFLNEIEEPPSVTFSFLHLTVQEFFAALVHYLDFNKEKLEKSLKDCQCYDDNRGEIFLRFLCGLSDISTGSIFKKYLGAMSTKTSKMVIEWLLKTIHETWKGDEYKDDDRKLLSAFVCLFETRNKDLVLQSLGSSKCFDFSYVPLTPLDCSIFPFILDSCIETEKLNLESCHIHSEGLEKLSQVLHTVKDLSLRNNGLKDGDIKCIYSALNKPNCKIQKLCLSSNSLTHVCCPQLASAIARNQSLKKLDLSYNNLSGPQFNDLMEALFSPTCRIEELLLIHCDLTDSSCAQLASPIRKSPSLRTLDLSDNRLEGSRFRDLLEALSSPTCKLEELILSCDGRKIDQSSIQLGSTISNNQSLRKLNLCGSKLVGPLFTELLDALSRPSFRIEELILRDTGLTDITSPQLAMAIGKNRSLRKLDLSYNTLGGPHFGDLMEALSSPSCRIEELLLENIKVITEHVSSLVFLKKNKNLRYLDLNRNSIDESKFTHIMEQMKTSPSMKELRMNFKMVSLKP
ncbi:NACHT, LRR and PYD domains-containing protein 12-like [Engystomops pustulosus]|uniref:NACHT, LRR and PYD domains-containing protein 12-like n=1 Tax=Engystomops pustulosus TaxID=76066 RepID=UPI003AFAFDB5